MISVLPRVSALPDRRQTLGGSGLSGAACFVSWVSASGGRLYSSGQVTNGAVVADGREVSSNERGVRGGFGHAAPRKQEKVGSLTTPDLLSCAGGLGQRRINREVVIDADTAAGGEDNTGQRVGIIRV